MQKEYVDTNIIENCSILLYADSKGNYCIKAFKNGFLAQGINFHNYKPANDYISAHDFKLVDRYYQCKMVIGHHETQIISHNGAIVFKQRNRQLLHELDKCRVYSYQ